MAEPTTNHPLDAFRMDRTRVRGVQVDDELDLRDWIGKSPQEKLEAIEFLRSQSYGTADGSAPRLQKTYRLVSLSSGSAPGLQTATS